MSILRQYRALVTAFQFLTRLPLPGGMNCTAADRSLLRHAVVFFPLVGGLIGALTGGVIWTAAQAWPPFVAVFLGLAVEAFITGAFHEDAVADCCDAFGGGWSRDDVLRIMKDSRIGSFGALGLTLAVLLRAGCLASLALPELLAVSIASAGLGRWAILIVMALVPPIPNREGLAKDVGERIGWREFLAGTLLAAPAAAWYATIDPWRLAFGASAIVVGALIWSWYVYRWLGGVTGDCLGFACYLGQVAFLLVAVAGRVPLAV